MEVITFTEKLAENSKYYPEFTDMRIILTLKLMNIEWKYIMKLVVK